MKPKLIYAFILGFIGFVTSFGAHIVAVNLPSYAKEMGVGLAIIGVLIAAYDFAEIVAKPIFGVLADRQGMKRTMIAGIILFIIASLLYLVISPTLLILVRFLQGLGAAALSSVSIALVAEYYSQDRGKAYGIYNAIKGAGYVLSPVIWGYIVLKSEFSNIFIATAAIGVLALILAFFLPKTKNDLKAELDDDDDFSIKAFIEAFRNPILLTWYLVIVINMFFVGILFGFLPVRIANLGYTPFHAGLVMSVVALSYILIQPIAGIIADKKNPLITIKIGLILSALSVMLIPFVSGILLILISIISGIGVGIVWTNTDTLVSNLAKKGALGQTVGIAGSFKEFGDMIGPLLIGLLSQAFGLTTGFVVCGILGLIAFGFIMKEHTTK